MMDVTKISSKGQVVIPKPIRDSLDLMEGDRLIAYSRGDLIIFKRLNDEESILSLLSQPIREKVEEHGITKKNVEDAVEWAKEQP
jgi:antitoxin PrlF